MKLEKILQSEKIGILGFGKEGQEFQKFLEKKKFSGEIFIFDENFLELKKKFGKIFSSKKIFFTDSKKFSDLKNLDFYFKSPGISRWNFPEIQKKFEEGKIFSGTEIFLEEIKNSNSKIIGVTGTKGKSTISNLIFHFLKGKFGDEKIELLGNFGTPSLNFLNCHCEKQSDVAIQSNDTEKEKNNNLGKNNLSLGKNGNIALDCVEFMPGTGTALAMTKKIFILELSSYQIEDLNPEKKLDFGLLLNIFPDHLDYHKGFENYKKAKEKILEISEKFFIGTEKKFLENEEFAEKFLDEKKIKLKGEHNKKNILFVSKFLRENFGFSEMEIKKGIEKFQPLKHRMEEFRHLNRLWINDAISTTPDSTIQCFKTYQNRINGVVLGGQDRGYNFTELTDFLTEIPNLKAIAIFENCPKILDSIEKKFFRCHCEEGNNVAIQSNDTGKEKNNDLGKNNSILNKNGNTALDCLEFMPGTGTIACNDKIKYYWINFLNSLGICEKQKNKFKLQTGTSDLRKEKKKNYFLNFLKQVSLAKPALDLKNLENNSSERKPKIFISNDLEKITKFLFKNSEKQGVITLSCASPSYGYFKNFEEKGEKFLEAIKKI